MEVTVNFGHSGSSINLLVTVLSAVEIIGLKGKLGSSIVSPAVKKLKQSRSATDSSS